MSDFERDLGKLAAIFNKKKCKYNGMEKLLIPRDIKSFKGPCNCKVTTDGIYCGESCEHRALDMICEVGCSNGLCSNQVIRKNSGGTGLVLFETLEMGIGVKTTCPIRDGEYVISYIGEVIDEKEYKRRLKKSSHSYGIHQKPNLILDPLYYGNKGRFINHHCNPNLEMRKNYVDLLPVYTLWALRDIKAGEELFYNYNFQNYLGKKFICRCGSENCKYRKTKKPSKTQE